ncbi:F-actin-uncapping protein LRRC16A-like [Hoplias malabaricus]|uniref:F-actin-uncapping protein LRRC16A-like n=1 Tax=Hoplias malabaricus TaxID=27720 RepID=UPI0034626AC6
MAGEEDSWKEVLESVQEAVGRQFKLTMKKKVQLEVKGDKLESRVLALAPHRAFLLTPRVPARTEQSFNLFDIQAISSSKPNQLVVDHDKGQLVLKLGSNEEVDEIIAQIGNNIQEHCPGLNPVRVMKRLTLKPAERTASLQTLWENNTPTDTGPCGVNILAHALCSNPSVFNTLAHLDLSGNSLRGDDLPNLWNFLGQPNSLQTLDLSNSDCALDLVCSSLLRGSLKNLSVLNLSKSVFSLKKGKELPSSFKQFFSSAQSLNTIILAGTRLPSEALKALLLGLACNHNLKEVSLDLSSCELRSAGSQILEGCIAEIPNISSLDISDNGLDSDLTTLLVWLAKNRSIRHLSLGKNFSNIKSKNIGQVLSSLVLMIQEEESPLSSLSLADSKLKADLSIVLNAVGGNSSLTRLDISGNSMGDMGAKMLAKALQINTKLRTVIWDRNNISAQGLQDVAAALEKNYTIRFMPVPIMDAALALKSNPEKTEDALMKMEQYLLRNHETRRYLQEQAYRLQQGIVTSTTQQMIDRLCVKVQDHLNSLRFSERESVLEDMRAAEKLVQDARNSKRLLASMYHLRSSWRGGGGVCDGVESPWVGPIQEKLQSMAGEISTVIDQQLQNLLVTMVDTAESVCPHVVHKANLRPVLMQSSEGKMSVPQTFITNTLLEQSAVDIINKISEVKLSLATFLSDRIIDEILESLSRSQHTLAEHLSRRGQPLLHHDSEEIEVVDDRQLQPENLPSPPAELLLTPTSKRKSILFRMVRPVSVAFELEFDLDKALEHVPMHMDDLPLPPTPAPLEAEPENQLSVCFKNLPETESPKLQHITKLRPRRKKTTKPSKPPALKRAPAEDLEQDGLGAKVDEGLDEFFAKKVTRLISKRFSTKDASVEGEKKRESRMSGFFSLIKSRSSIKTPPTSPHTNTPTATSITPTTITAVPMAATPNTSITASLSIEESDEVEPIKTVKEVKSPVPEHLPEPVRTLDNQAEKSEPRDHGDVVGASETKGHPEESKKREGPQAGRIRGVQVMGNDFLAQLRAKQEKMKEKAPESSVPTAKAEPDHGEGDTSIVEKLLHKEHHPEPALRAHAPHSQPKHGGPAPALISQHVPLPIHTPAAKLSPASTQAPPKSSLSPHPVNSKQVQNPQPSGPPANPGRLQSQEHLPSPLAPLSPLSSPPSSCSSSTSADDITVHPRLPALVPDHKGAPSETDTEEQSPVHPGTDGVLPHILLDTGAEDSVFEAESHTHAAHTPETGQRGTSRLSSTNPAKETADLTTPTDPALALSFTTEDSHILPQPSDHHSDPTPETPNLDITEE